MEHQPTKARSSKNYRKNTNIVKKTHNRMELEMSKIGAYYLELTNEGEKSLEEVEQ